MNCLKCLLPIEAEQGHYGLHKECFTAWFKAPETTEFISLTRQSDSNPNLSSTHSPYNNSFFQGRFKKYSAELNGVSYILKMREGDAPEMPEVEYLCNQIGQSLNIQIADFYIIDFYGDRTFVTKSFIKAGGSPKDLQHIHHFRADQEHNCEDLIKVIAKHTQKPYDVNQFIKQILFDALIGNNDRHGKNLGLIVTSKETILSPSYDNVSYLSLEKGEMLKADFNPTGKISTQATFEPSMRDYVKELQRLDYANEINQFHRKIDLSAINILIDNSFCSDLMKQAIKKLIAKRYQEITDELKS